MKVLKFGGTSVGSADAIQVVAQIVKKAGPCMVVCSAMSGVTNKLLQMASNAEKGEEYSSLLQQLETQHLHTIERLLPSTKQNPSIIYTKICMNEIEAILQSVHTLRELTERGMAALVSYGERLSCTIIADYLCSLDMKAVYTDARELLVTTQGYNQAPLKAEESYQKLQAWSQQLKGAIPVITGFISANEQGITTNLGRGGSDYTASIVGAALQVDSIEIWTDVDGFFTADPRLVPKAFPLKEISYSEALELSYFGAKVIYAPTLIPAINKQIPIWIKNTFNLEAEGTLIHREASKREPIVKGISSIQDISLINIIGNGMVGFKGFSARLFHALSRAEVNVILITQASSEHTITIAVSPTDKEKAMTALLEEFQYEIKLNVIETPVVEDELSIVAVVGSQMHHEVGVSGRLFTALGRSNVNVSAIAQGSSELNISVVVKQKDLQRSLNAIHDAMFLSSYKTVHLYVAGIGSIGQELLQQIHQANDRLKTQHGIYLQLAGVANSRKMLLQSGQGIPLDSWKEALEKNGQPADIDAFIATMGTDNLPNAVFVDNTANADVASKYGDVFEHKVSIVTCNKIACSSSLSSYKNLKQSCVKKGLRFLYETNVGAGLPVIQTLQDLVMSGDEILKVEAVLSGTISFIFNSFKGDVSFSDIVKKAQELGYTEPDPRDDLNGLDFARKALILSREMGMNLEMEDISLQPMLPPVCFEVKSVDDFYMKMRENEEGLLQLKKQAEDENKVIRYIATITPGEVSISLKLIDAHHPFYSLSGSDNIISFTTVRYKNNPLVVKGPGAGVAVTAAGVFADIMKISMS